MTHATAAELQDYLGESVPTDADRLLQRASELIDTFVMTPYAIDDITGLATEQRVVDELRNATCAQVEYWMKTGDEADVLTERDAVSFPGALSVSGKGRRLAPRAADALRRGGLSMGAEAV